MDKFEVEATVEFARIMPVYKDLPNDRKRRGLNLLKAWVEGQFKQLHEEEKTHKTIGLAGTL